MTPPWGAPKIRNPNGQSIEAEITLTGYYDGLKKASGLQMNMRANSYYPEHFIKIFHNRDYGKRNRRIELLRFAFQSVQFVTEISLARDWTDSEKRSPFGRADLATSAALQAEH
jgi:hypothetical protein